MHILIFCFKPINPRQSDNVTKTQWATGSKRELEDFRMNGKRGNNLERNKNLFMLKKYGGL